MRVTLVNADFPSATPVPPLGVLSLAQAAETGGHAVTVRDYQLAPTERSRDPPTFARFCDTSDPVLGVSTSGMALPLVLLGLRELKRNRPQLVTVLGGIGAAGAAEKIVAEFPWIDLVARGEGEETLTELLDCLEAGGEPAAVPGLVCRRKGQAYVTPSRPRLTDLDRLGEGSLKHLELGRYKLINVISARGCPFDCAFCDVARYWDRRYVPRSTSLVVGEMEAIAGRVHPCPTFVFVDDTLTVNRTRVEELCLKLHQAGLEVEWACYARADTLDEPLLELMATSGCRKVYLGLESGSDRVLTAIRKGFDAASGRRAALLAKRFIPIVQTSFVWGFPFETWEDFYETLLLMAHLVAHGISVKANVLTPFPFSPLFADLAHSMVFVPDYSPQLLLAEYEMASEIVALIRAHPRIFPCFYLYDSSTLTAKYDLLREMGLSPEHIWDLWAAVKGPVPSRTEAKRVSVRDRHDAVGPSDVSG